MSLGPTLSQLRLVDDIGVVEAIHFNTSQVERAARASAVPGATSGKWLCLCGAGAFVDGDYDVALDAWARVPREHKLHDVVRSWSALALAYLNRLPAALERVDKGSHLEGELLMAMGRADEGSKIVREVLAADPDPEWRTLRYARWLRRLGRPLEAAEVLEDRLLKIARFEPELRVEAILSWCEVGEGARALPHLDWLDTSIPALVERLIAEAPLSEMFKGGAAPKVGAFADGVFSASAQVSARLTQALPKGPVPELGVLPGQAMWGALADAGDYEVVAQCFVRPSRVAVGGDNPALLLKKRGEEGRVWLCLDTKIPTFLWPSVALEEECAVSRLLAPYRRVMATQDPKLTALPRRLRLFLGGHLQVPSSYHGQLEAMDFHTFGRVAVCSPFLEAIGWGSEKHDDPLVHFVDRGRFDALHARQRNGGRDPGRPLMESWRTRHSRSVFTLEQHHAGFVADVRYAPSPHAEATAAFNRRFGTTLAEDLPLDCVGVLMHFDGALSVEQLQEKLPARAVLPRDEWWRYGAVAALLHEELALDAWLVTLPEGAEPVVRQLASIYGRLGFLLEGAQARQQWRDPLQFDPALDQLWPREEEADDDE